MPAAAMNSTHIAPMTIAVKSARRAAGERFRSKNQADYR